MEGSSGFDFARAQVMSGAVETEPVWMDSVRLILALEASRNHAEWRLSFAETSAEETATRQNIEQLNKEIKALITSLDPQAEEELVRLRDERLKAK